MKLKQIIGLKSDATVILWTIKIVILLLTIAWADCNLNTSQDESSSLSTPSCPPISDIEECLLNTYVLFDQRNYTGIPDNEQELLSMCSAFRHGFDCLDSFTNKCLTSDEQRIYRDKVDGIRKAMESLCNDSQFHSEYLKHSHCYKQLSNEWDECSRPLLTLVNHEQTQVVTSAQIVYMCRIKQTFLDCVTAEAQKRCDKVAAEFLRQLAETLSGSMDRCPRQIGSTSRHEAKESRANELYNYLYLTLFSTTMAILTS
ncbi:hypothetical protein CHUAL_002953 [Chamberlinius hualienensis]